MSPSVIKKQLDKFETANIRIYELNKRSPFYKELVNLLKKARSRYEDEERMNLIRKKRTRPRSNKKPLEMRSDNE